MLGLSIVVLVVSLALSPPSETKLALPLVGIELPSLCVWRNTTGISCPGCGLTRAFVCLAHGQWSQAWKYNPAGVLMFAGLLAQLPYRGVQLWRLSRRRREWDGLLLSIAMWALILSLLLQWTIRLATGTLT